MSDTDLFIGRTIGNRYEIVSKIDQLSHGNSDWYHAKSLLDATSEDVGLALIWNQSEPCFEELKVHFSKPLIHENIQTVLDFGRDEASSHLFIATEAIYSEPLSSILDGRKRSSSFVSSLINQLCSGVKAAHARGIVHGAIEPENILIRESDDAPKIKIMNYGVHSIFNNHIVIDDREPEIGFNPYYHSPEQIKGQKPNERTDVYGLGCLLYAMLSGDPPYSEHKLSAMHVLFAKVTEEPVPLSDKTPEVSQAMTEVVMKAISTDPLQRYSSADELHEAFSSVGH